MNINIFYSTIDRSRYFFTRLNPGRLPLSRPTFGQLCQTKPLKLPLRIQSSPLCRHYLELLRPIAWAELPARQPSKPYPGPQPHSLEPFVVAFLIKLDRKLATLSELVRFLKDHPELIWLCGFPLKPDTSSPFGFHIDASLPSAARFSYVLRHLSDEIGPFLLTQTIIEMAKLLPVPYAFGDVVGIDTRHHIAWVKENNPKAFVKERFDKNKQPDGDRDCKLGCKRSKNQRKTVENLDQTPKNDPIPAQKHGVAVGEFYWGYGSGIATTILPNGQTFILAELTQTFDKSDVSYFFPLMTQVEARLGRKPRFGTADAAYDAFYCYQYFHKAGGFAAIPLVNRGGKGVKQFNNEGAPLCEADLPMTWHSAYNSKTSTVPHRRDRWACPLLHPTQTADACPIGHEKWGKGGCQTVLPQSIGARLRYQIDRESILYKKIYKQRTATERIFSQAVDLGIERPKLRNGRAIAHQNSLTYVLINLRTLMSYANKRKG